MKLAAFPSFAFLAAVVSTLAGCDSLQRLPGPMPLAGSNDELGPPETRTAVARLVRHGDPVQMRPAGEAGTVMLAFYRKQADLDAGSWVFTGASGRAEILRPGAGSSVILFGPGAAKIGDGRENAWLELVEFERARLLLVPGDQVQLPGGALLEVLGERAIPTGPFVLDQGDLDVYRIHNQGPTPGRVRYRDAIMVLQPSERLSLARIDPALGGTQPVLAQKRTLAVGSRTAEVLGEVVVTPQEGDSFRLTARGGPATIFLQGLRVDLADGEETVWRFPEPSPPQN